MLIAKQLVIFLASPLCLSLCFLAASLYMFKLNKVRVVKNLTIASFALLLIFSQPWIANLLLYPLEFPSTQQRKDDVQPNYIFVPACYYHTEGDVPMITRWHECSLQRMLEAINLNRTLQLPIIVTGGKFLHDEDTVFAEEARHFLLNFGVTDNDIIVIPKGWNTKSEVSALKTHVTDANLLAVTSATHQRRLSFLLTDAGFQHIVHSVDYHSAGNLKFHITSPSANALESISKAAYEYAAILKYALYDDNSSKIDH